MTDRRLNDIIETAISLPPEERQAHLVTACGDDEALLAAATAGLVGALEQDAAPGEASIDLGPGDRIGPYRLRDVLGEGGMGTVFLADQSEPVSRKVAIKIIKLGMDTREVLARFRAEQQALALMSHPNIAGMHDAGATDRGRPYFVMEYVPGVPITEFADTRRCSVDERLELFGQACDAVAHAHGKGLIHRDLKPSNILVSEAQGKGTVKVIDFGIAKSTQQRLVAETLYTRLGVFIGTPNYSSPEQASAGQEDVDARTDVYSLGVLLYELMVGRPPFDAATFGSRSLDEIRQFVRSTEPPTPAERFRQLGNRTQLAERRDMREGELARQLAGPLGGIIAKAMHRDRSRRYPSAAALREDVWRLLAGQPVEARPAGRTRRIPGWAALGLVAIVGGAALLAFLPRGVDGPAPADDTAQRTETPSAAAAPLVAPPRVASIAVLPFEDLSPGQDQGYFSKGLAEELLNVLARVDALRVASRTSSFQFFGRDDIGIRDIASRLDVGYVVEGSVRTAGDQLRITAQLIDAIADEHLWSETFDRSLTTENLFEIQDDIARAIVTRLGDRLRLPERVATQVEVAADTRNLAAYEAFLEARERFLDRGGMDWIEPTIEGFERATTLDPDFARAWAGLAGATVVLPDRGFDDRDYFAIAEQAAERALALDPNSSMAMAVRGLIAISRDRDFLTSDEWLSGAIAADPRNATAWHWRGIMLLRLGFIEEANEHETRCLEIDPMYANCAGFRLSNLALLGETLAVEREAERLVDRFGARLGSSPSFIFGNLPIPEYPLLLLRDGRREDAERFVAEASEQIGYDLGWSVRAIADPGFDFEAVWATLEETLPDPRMLHIPTIQIIFKRYDEVATVNFGAAFFRLAHADYLTSPERRRLIEAFNLPAYWEVHGYPPGCRPDEDQGWLCE